MTDRRFVHLHCHSHYSLLDGASTIDRLVERTQALGMNALALTDHGNLHGALEFYTKAKEAGINPILGYEAYVAPKGRRDREASSSKEASFHLTLLAKNRTGFRNLIQLASHASLEGFYFKPRIDKELLEKYHEGLICLSGCISSEFSRAIVHGANHAQARREAMEVAGWFHRLFGDRYFIEIMNSGFELQKLHLEAAVDIATQMGLPMVATCDAHYVEKEDADAQDLLLCINTGKFKTDQNRMRMDVQEYYLKSPEQMYELFSGLEESVSNSQRIADQVEIDLELGKRHFPSFATPGDKSADDYLRELCLLGLNERYLGNEEMRPGGQLAQVVMDRLDRELGVISRLGFSNYFLIVWDFVRYARELGVPATARGSGVGALVCYGLYLSHVCPIKYDLLFERFLDENRKEAPDIDIDFCKERRAEIIKYVKDKYGEQNVAQIGTFGTMAAKAAIKDVGRALGLPLQRVVQVGEMIPDELKITIDKALEKNEELRQLAESDEDVGQLIYYARKLEGLARNVGTHAAAVVIADRPLTEYVPLCRVTGKTDIITQWSMGDVESAGLLKMDFLGLRNLTILSHAVDLIQQSRGETIDPLKFPLEDQATFALLQRGETKGVFQLESGGIRDLLQKMKPDHFRDIIATNALYRPGPLEGGMVEDYVAVKHNRKKAVYAHPVLESILAETHGVMVYQEQVMRILNRLGGIELAKAYTCIKAISKKKKSIIDENAEKFLEGAVAKGMGKAEAKEFWEMILKFAGYGFNKSHSTAYALIAYQTAYLKAHYPTEFMAALLTGDIPGRNFKQKDSLVEHIEDCQRMGIEVLQPNINHSGVGFVVDQGKIYFGLSAIKGCGGAAAESIVEERRKNGPFRDLWDFCERVDPSACNRAAIETLIKAGAFDCLGGARSQWMAVLDKAISAGASKIKDRKIGQKNLFDAFEQEDDGAATKTQSLPAISEFPEKEKLAFEKEVLGFYFSSHPLEPYRASLTAYTNQSTKSLRTLQHREEVMVGGMIGAIKLAHTRNPKPGAPSKYANFDLEDLEGVVRCILWPDGFADQGEMVKAESVVLIKGAVDRRSGDEANLIVNEIIPIEEAAHRFTTGLRIDIEESLHGEAVLPALDSILKGYQGTQTVVMVLRLASGDSVAIRNNKHRVEVVPELRARLDDLLGPNSHRLIAAKPERSGPPPKKKWQK